MSPKGILSIGQLFPTFKKTAVVGLEKGKEFITLTSDDLINNNGKWTFFFWWPKDFTAVCPTEIIEFNKALAQFTERNTRIIGASTDSEYSHLAWRTQDERLKNIEFPLLADTSKSLAEELGILEQTEKVAFRATFIIDPSGIIRWVSVYGLSIGRNVNECLRVIDALQTKEFCPCNWEKGECTLS